MDKGMRRSEKAMTREESMEVLEKAEYGVLSTISTDQTPYGTPMNFVYQDGAIYFHCALTGHRLENLAANSSACLTVTDSVKLMPEKFNTQYRSVIVFGTVQVVEDQKEKRKGITAILKKLSPDYLKAGEDYINSAFEKLHVLRLDIEKISGKATRG
ncbi:pyridoxamine 5'-phosphate oxidase family protein [Ihubacter massiliensis]|uniref:Pyridoxamine 5'-phosphate oxidase family protein n=1 Tax=Hominibacterium faecale TaxID=2839743 RepID=A0A9J6QI33_9FIRM|nr:MULTISPECIES: pyridoxamine 5'-phosphate oxidase family protein [Eubacteriales Family XIII. Incertae Sedis]MCI7304270.1 pyridoxamine 5'-phosphate oxidase family protein [Clostridia bacterium]MCO7122887.1 pyridoxamine 5'-phosphate oxidase family protein [Ihubacter massiliensis]MCU7377160.1 pyridoxamine 5'-phosphate oxidase family protein [Hominibacterium faecale]MDY3010989.1 pyridoxamine 5'-phosphate oxidase family protein [Clostridiales Family XIII bacterium]